MRTGLMNQILRSDRVRLLVKKLNKKRKKQETQIDILCNDLVSAHRDFIKRLYNISFIANFYESIMGTADLRQLIQTSAKIIHDELLDVNISFFLRTSDDFELHCWTHNFPPADTKHRLEDFFNLDTVNKICSLNRPCSLEEIFTADSDAEIDIINNFSAAALPLNPFGPPLGFMLIYRAADNKLTDQEIKRLSAVTSGLARAILASRVPSSCRN